MKLKTLLLTVLLTTSLIGITYAASSDGWKAYQAKDYVAAFKEWKPLAEQGDEQAQFRLGSMYQYGKGVPQDDKEAVKWYRKAAEQGVAGAQIDLGWMYRAGKGVPQDDKEAVKWYRKAAEQGDEQAQFRLGSMYQYGKGVPQDDKEAVKWYRKAAEQGDAPSQYTLGAMYDLALGVTEDDKEAVKWYRKAAEQGHDVAQNNLGAMYKYGTGGVPQDDKVAFKWYKKAAEQGFATAQFNLGRMYRDGDAVLKDYQQVVNWYRKAAEQGHARAQYDLGVMYARGEVVLKDMIKAKYWFKKAYQGDNAEISKYAKKKWDLYELWKYKSKKDSGSFATNKTPKQKEHYSSSGTGFRVDKKGMLITNYHVVKGCSDVKVNGNKVVVKSTDSRNDLALLQGSPSSLIPYFRAGRSIRLGDIVIIAGYPLQSVLGSGLNVTTGTVASLSGLGNNTSRMQITAPINSGNSGGPVFDNSGRIVGVVVSKINTTKAREILGEDIQGANFAIKGSVVRSFLDMNDVDYEVSSSNKNMSTADIAENAKEYTALIKCWK